MVTSTNPPLKEFCRKYGVGQASEDYEKAIRVLAEHYTQQQDAVRRFLTRVHVEKNNRKLAEEILVRLGEN